MGGGRRGSIAVGGAELAPAATGRKIDPAAAPAAKGRKRRREIPPSVKDAGSEIEVERTRLFASRAVVIVMARTGSLQ